MERQKDAQKVKAGLARAAALTPEERSASAVNAANARWSAEIPQARHDGNVRIADTDLFAAVLPTGKRLLTQSTFLKAVGRSSQLRGGGSAMMNDEVPAFLQVEALNPFLTEDLMSATTPIQFRTSKGVKAIGYDANLLPMVCEVYLKWRDDIRAKGKEIPVRYTGIIATCDALMRGLARVGIAALIDEATGYQEVRDKKALSAILDQYLSKEFAAWAKQFPNEFYKQLFRLRGWEWRELNRSKSPMAVALYTKNLVYARLAPGLLEGLEKRNPRENGYREQKHHQWLTEDVGKQKLHDHILQVIGMMRMSPSWSDFMAAMEREFPKLDSGKLKADLPPELA